VRITKAREISFVVNEIVNMDSSEASMSRSLCDLQIRQAGESEFGFADRRSMVSEGNRCGDTARREQGEMKKQSDEFEKFDSVMGGILAVPYKELHDKLEQEKREKTKHKKKRTTSPGSSRASSSQKKRVA
jgi:hypothetical protein